jgi:hypothetical protein
VAYDSNWKDFETLEFSWALPTGLVLVSFGWWESFVSEDSFSPGTDSTKQLYLYFTTSVDDNQ